MTKRSSPTTKLTRRELLRFGSLAAAGSLTMRFQPAMAGPFEGADFKKLVPADKKLSAAWLRSLIGRGDPEWFSGGDLQHIGMPVGGICCGQVYLSGDGRLWHWDIFNQDVAPKNRTAGPHYAKPMPVASAVDLGFTIRANGETRSLDRAGFPQLRFRGAYPIGFVEFRDEAFPVKVSLATLALEHEGGDKISVKLGDTNLAATLKRTGKRVLVTLAAPVEIAAGGQLVITGV